MSKPVSWALEPTPVPTGYRLRRALARCLRAASAALARFSRRLYALPAMHRRDAEPVFEFHAEAGAPEGALFIDGLRVGTLEGVRRL